MPKKKNTVGDLETKAKLAIQDLFDLGTDEAMDSIANITQLIESNMPEDEIEDEDDDLEEDEDDDFIDEDPDSDDDEELADDDD